MTRSTLALGVLVPLAALVVFVAIGGEAERHRLADEKIRAEGVHRQALEARDRELRDLRERLQTCNVERDFNERAWTLCQNEGFADRNRLHACLCTCPVGDGRATVTRSCADLDAP